MYALYCSSVLGLAALYADDSIKEFPCPSEIGGYLIELYPAFHKVFVSTGTSQIEIDTDADPHYDATGLGRFQVKGVPIELGLSMPFTAHPMYRMADSLKPQESYAIGPAWMINDRRQSIATTPNLSHQTTITHLKKDTISFSMTYSNPTWEDMTVKQDYSLTANELTITSSVHPQKGTVDSTYFIVPLLVSDGNTKSTLNAVKGDIKVDYMGHSYNVRFDKSLHYDIPSTVFANRNGMYKNLVISSPGNTIQVRVQLK